MPGRDLSYYLDLATGQIRRYGCAEPRVDRALLRVLATTGRFCHDPDDRALIAGHVQLVVEDAERTVPQPADLEPVRAHAALVLASSASLRDCGLRHGSPLPRVRPPVAADRVRRSGSAAA